MDTIKLIQYLANHVTEERLAQFKKVLNQRTRYLSVALEDIYQPQNASAVLRTMDCFGVQDVHIVENQNEYRINPDVALGASKWLTMTYYNKQAENTMEAIAYLKKQNYRIVATTPHEEDVDLPDFDLSKGKAVLFFGTEMRGVSDKVLEAADEYLKIPMYGFTESFNISVSAAITLYELTSRLRGSEIEWRLTEREQMELLLEWLKKSIKRSDLIVQDFLSKQKNI